MRRSQSSPDDKAKACLTVAAVALEFGISNLSLQLDNSCREPRRCFARQVAMYLFHTIYQVNLTRTAQLFDPVFEQKISRLEHFLAQTPQMPNQLFEAA